MFKIILFNIIYFNLLSQVIADINVSHAIAMHGEPKYQKDFTHVDYVNPNALIKVAKLFLVLQALMILLILLLLKGTSAVGIGNLFETLTTSSSDEAFTEYGLLLAETIEWPDDRSWVAFNLRKEAKWHDGKSVIPEDVIWTFQHSNGKRTSFL